MMRCPPPSLRLTLDTSALAANWHALDTMSSDAQAGAAVKADAYGLGIDRVVPVLHDAGARQFFVAHWSEVPGVLDHVAPRSISVLHGPITRADAEFAIATGVVPVINSLPQARIWADAGGSACHLMVDTGINRLGIAPQEIGDPAIARLQVDTLMSHLASADEDSSMNVRQLALFEEISGLVSSKRRSLANSAGIVLGAQYHFDLTRPGLALYGGIPRREFREAIRQVAFPQAAIIQRRDVSAGESVGYNATFTATENMRVGVVSLGYADGFLRSRGPGASLRHEEANLPILGKVSMDMIVVDLASAPQLREGDWLDVPFDLPAVEQASDLSQYELLTTLGRRFRSD